MRRLLAVTLSTWFTFGAITSADSAVKDRPTGTITPSRPVAPPLQGENPVAPKATAVTQAPTRKPDHVAHVGEPVRDEYLVFLEDGDRRQVPAAAAALAHAHSGRLLRVWNDGVQGFWISMNAAEAEAMLHDPRVRAVEENAVAHTSTSQDVSGIVPNVPVPDPFWHLDRIDQRSPTLDGTFQYCSGATQVYAYIFDRGVRATDPQLNGRVTAGKNASPADSVCASNNAADQPPPYADGGSFNEQNPCGTHNVLNVGHGTSVATLLAGSAVGVSKTAKIVPIRLQNCQNVGDAERQGEPQSTGSWIDSFDWLFGASNTLWDSTNQVSLKPAVANFSVWFLVASPNIREFEAERRIRQLVAGGVVVVVSANNDNTDIGSVRKSPARLSYSNPITLNESNEPLFAGPERVIAVGGTMRTNGLDQRWVCPPGGGNSNSVDPCLGGAGSNYGLGVDIWAPAHDIQSGNIALLLPGTGDPWTGAQYRRPFLFGPADRGPLAACTPSTEDSKFLYARSGTSFSAPLVAGAAARLLSEDSSLFDASDPSSTAASRALTVWNRLKASATHLDATAADLRAGSPDLFLYIGGVNFKTQPQSVTMTASSATLTAEAVGTGLSYQLYEGQSGNMSIPVGSAQSSGTFTVSPTSTKTYWIQGTNTCPADSTTVTGDSAEATVTVSTVTLSTPTINARTQDANSRNVHVSWSLVSGATSYRVERATCTATSCWAQVTVSNSATISSYDDMPPLVAGQPVTTYLYRVVALAGSSSSTPSAIDFATTATTLFAEPIGYLTLVSGSHVKELRNAIDGVRVAAGLSTSGQGWTGWPASYTNATGLIYGTDVGAMRRALNQAISILKPGFGFSPVTDPSGLISSSDFNNLREAVR